MSNAARKAPRAGQTEKISVSVDRTALAHLRKRADRLHGGNLSAALADGIRLLEEEEGRQALLKWLGPAAIATKEEYDEIVAEWHREPPTPAKKRRAKR